MLKQCTKCGEEKKLEEFGKDPRLLSGVSGRCRECVRKKNQRYKRLNKEKVLQGSRSYREKNLEKCRKRENEYNKKNREKRREYQKEYRKNNKQKRKRDHDSWRSRNRGRLRVYYSRYHEDRSLRDPSYLIACRLRDRLNKAIKKRFKSGSAVRDLGCSIEELKRHLESKFNSRMNWKNWGTYWHIDHFFPLAESDLEDRVEFLAVNNWRNLQPLTAPANLKKGDTVLPEARELFEELKAEFAREVAA